MNRTNVVLLFGGESSEHDVSIASARNVYAAINKDKFAVTLCYIDGKGKWWRRESFSDDGGDMGEELVPVLGGGGFLVNPSHEVVNVDVILPILHGRNGEDGSVQGLAQLMHIPIVGCDVTASAIGMDKRASKEIVMAHGIAVVPYSSHTLGESEPLYSELVDLLGGTLFVKPVRAGSSVGVSKVMSQVEFDEALCEAHKHDAVVLIEKAVKARELEVAVLGTPPRHQISGIGEIVPGEDFYSYDDKYSEASAASVVIPADISEQMGKRIKSDAATIYQALGCSGLSRVDFFLDENNELYFNEINTLPGFTNISMYPKLWRQEGVDYPQLIEMLIEDALTDVTIETTT